ncbi:CinA family protein [Campylobacter sp. RM16192]|uniref:CinA family protein n=1 Tax=Campylobacter sp. RM16192 TaxID=1660080 RepID=UPI0014523969|nr:CinA family protein [Campylobacter sp. RM16192]QCD53084.1 competence/damage-inducible domain protein [Campylobacter sp. RM16192]
MKNALLIIGEDLNINSTFLNYILSCYKAHFKELGEFSFVNKSDKELPFIIENLCSKFDTLCIFASNENYATTAKILSTLSEDLIELKEHNTLAPSKALTITKDSFLINLNETQVNLIKAVPTKEIGQIHIKPNINFTYFSLFDIDSESTKILLEPIAKTYEVQIYLSQIIENLVIVRAEANKFGQIESFINGVKNLFSQKFIASKNLVKHIAKTLIRKNLKITFAESCTAGLIAAKFGQFAGVSAAFDGSLITYANEIKAEWLGVGKDTLETYGAVSEQCVNEMLSGAIRSSGADFALAVSGIAGPDGGSVEKPVGTVFVGALSKNGKIIVDRLNLNGDRNYIREQSALHAYTCLLRIAPEIFFE